jgi:hypothetical protein
MFEQTEMDVVLRHRMRGDLTLWLPERITPAL